MTERHLSIPIEDGIIRGDLMVPDAARGLVLFAHGSGSSRLSSRNQFVARSLNDASLATLQIDLLTEPEEAEDGDSGALRFDIGLLADRLLAATEFVGIDAEVSALPLGYFGASTGAAAALAAEVRANGRVRAIVSRGGRPDLAGDALPHVSAPTLLIVGSLDDVVLQLNWEAFDQLRCEKHLEVVHGASHLFEEPGTLQQVAKLAAEWFTRHLCP